EAKKIIDTLPDDAKIIALPWHQYLSLPFNRYQISANPTRLFFGDRIIQSENMELADVTGLQPGSLAEKIDWLLTQNSLPPETISRELQLLGINYAIVLNELLPYDQLQYPLLITPDLIPLYSSPEISLYGFPVP
ncbi:hypothetical protein KKC47_00675, partial [Patescibacteria group bacterium]|nr:hypothetical protein [Patescibacteria group bacterium]